MSNWFDGFVFLRPWFLLLAIVPLLLHRFYSHGQHAQSSWKKVIDPKLLDFLLIKGSTNKRRFLLHTALCGMIIGAIILAGPSWKEKEMPVLQKQNPVMIMLNMSSDMTESDIKPNRLERAKYKITDFLEQLTTVQVGLGVYSKEPFIIAPFTDDAKIVQNLLPKVTPDIMPVNGDRLDRAINAGVERLKSSGYEEGNLIIIAADVGQGLSEAIEAAKTAQQKGVNLSIIAATDKPNDKLKLVADAAGGNYYNLVKDEKLIDRLAQKINATSAPAIPGDNMSKQKIDCGWYLLFIPMLCCLAMFRKGILLIILLLNIGNAYAGFWTNGNQDGLKAFEQQNFAQAAENFKDNDWRAASYYRQGNFTEALKYYALNNSVEGLYNQGNALAKSGKIAEAIAKYEKVLQQEPNHEDAKFNLEYLKQQQQQQQNQQSSASQGQNDNQQQNDEQQQSGGNNNQDRQNNQDNQSAQDKENNNKNNPQTDKQESQDSNQGDKNSQQNSQGQQDDMKQNNSNPTGGDEENNDKQEQAQGAYRNEMKETEQPPADDNTEHTGQTDTSEGDEEDYDEKVQAKMQRYRDIPEDPGGLLRAFMAREYQKNRYND